MGFNKDGFEDFLEKRRLSAIPKDVDKFNSEFIEMLNRTTNILEGSKRGAGAREILAEQYAANYTNQTQYDLEVPTIYRSVDRGYSQPGIGPSIITLVRLSIIFNGIQLEFYGSGVIDYNVRTYDGTVEINAKINGDSNLEELIRNSIINNTVLAPSVTPPTTQSIPAQPRPVTTRRRLLIDHENSPQDND